MIKKLICRLFGHEVVEEVYVTTAGKPRMYYVCREEKCLRCGKTISFQMSDPKRRSTLLQEGWFIEE